MTRSHPITRAALRRHLALAPDGHRAALRPLLFDAAAGMPEHGPAALAAYLCDPLARAIAAPPSDEALARWLAGPLFEPVVACHAVPIADEVAAIVCAEMFARDGRISGALERRRFSPRSDVAIAAALATLPSDAGAAEVERLARAAGPDEDRLHLALMQAGRALAWSPQLWAYPIATELVDRLLALLSPESSGPLLHEVTRALGPIAYLAEPLGARVREVAARRLREEIARIRDPRPAASFAELVQELSRERRVPDQDHWESLPRRQVVAACARLLGVGAPPDPARFAEYQGRILAELPEVVLDPFVDGLILAAAVPQLTALAETLAAGDPDAQALALDLAARFPLDARADASLAALDASDPALRVAAVSAVAWLDGDAATDALAARLSDPEPEVAARAARALVDRGALDRVRAAAAAGDLASMRAATLALVAGDLSTRAISTVVSSALAALDTPDGPDVLADSVVMDVLAAALFGTSEGLATCANLVAAAPDALPVVALAAAHDPDELDHGIHVPPEGGRELAGELFALVARGGEVAAQALVVLARLFCGDLDLVAPLADALEHTDGWADHLIAAIATLRVRDPAFARVLGPHLADRGHIGARVLACAAAGRALPIDDPAWAHVDELFSLGTLASAAAWSARRDRVRFAPP
jgi:hypothetical protein